MQKWEYTEVGITALPAFDKNFREVKGVIKFHVRVNGKTTLEQTFKNPADGEIGKHIANYLNTYGEQGWELVAVNTSVYIFKRPVQ